MRAREYAGPLGVLAAGVLGFSLICSVSAMAMSDLKHYVAATIAPLNILDLAVSNLNTAAALTQQAVTAFVPTSTLVPSRTALPESTPIPSATSRRFVTITPTVPRKTREPAPTQVFVPIIHTNTPVPPTSTPLLTDTPLPPPTDTAVPPTDTPLPPSTDTSIPPTDTPLPPPTDTSIPPTDVPTLSSLATNAPIVP